MYRTFINSPPSLPLPSRVNPKIKIKTKVPKIQNPQACEKLSFSPSSQPPAPQTHHHETPICFPSPISFARHHPHPHPSIPQPSTPQTPNAEPRVPDCVTFRFCVI